MRSLEKIKLDAEGELTKAKDFIKTYDVSLPTKFLTLYVFLTFSVLWLLIYIPVVYTFYTIVYYVFKEFNDVTPNGDLYDSKTMSKIAEEMMEED